MKNKTFSVMHVGLISLLVLLIIITIHLVILKKIVFFPYPELFIYSYLTDAGLTPYKQIFDQHFPGIMMLPVNFTSLGIDNPGASRILHLAIVALNQVLLFLIAKKLTKSNFYSLVTNLLYLIWQPFFEGYVLWIDLMVVPLLLLGYLLLLEDKRIKYFLSGFTFGAAILFKQIVIPIVGVVVIYMYFFLKKKTKLRAFLFGIAIPIIILGIWVLKSGILKEFVYWTLTFNLTIFAQMGRKFPSLGNLIQTAPVFGLALISLMYILYKTRLKVVIYLSLIFVGSLMFAYARFDYVHLQPALPFALLTITMFFREFSRPLQVFMLSGFILISVISFNNFFRLHIGNRIMFFGEFEVNLSEKVLSYANKGDSIFIMGTTPHIYQMTETIPSGRVFAFQFPWFMVAAEEKIYEGVISDPPKVVLRDAKAAVQGMNIVSYMPKIDSYVRLNYKTIEKVGDVEIMISNDSKK